MIPLNQLIPECLLALGGAFLLGNLAAYIRLRPAWREAKEGRGGQAPKRDAEVGRGGRAVERAAGTRTGTTAKVSRTGRDGTTAGRGGPGNEGRGRARSGGARAAAGAESGRTGSGNERRGQARSGHGGAKAAARTRAGSSGRVNARVREPTAPGSRLPSRARVLANVLIGLVITVAALAALIRG